MVWLRFSATIEIRGINPYVLVSIERAQKLRTGWRKPMPVLVQINGKPDEPWHINMMPVGDGSYYLYLHEAVRKASQTGVDDLVKVAVCFDADYREGPQPLPDWLEAAFCGDTKIRSAWEVLSPSRQKEIVRYLVGMKSAEARERNLERTVQMLGGAEGRFMGRDWKDGR